MIQLEENFDGHIILYCKGWYNKNNVDFIIGLQRIWAVRCGHDVEHIDRYSLEYIVNGLLRIIKTITSPERLDYLQSQIHKELVFSKEQPLEAILRLYRSHIWGVEIINGKKKLINLPKPQKRLFNKIVNGKGSYNDYKLVKG